ncbi:VaFE repeat-containing surface-anchored protein [Trueperella sp. LYQ141]|uniref:VaFE repeat-containing surface-anchored protein n=1 Tax=Trueperella sp. LYQ141 TaxID=3391058 RepID=UPI003982E375
MSTNHTLEPVQRKATRILAAGFIMLSIVIGYLATMPSAYAEEYFPGSQQKWRTDDGGWIRLGAIAPPVGSGNDNPVYCTDMAKNQPGIHDSVTIATLRDSQMWGPPELDMTTAQLAWLMAKYQYSRDSGIQSALSYVIHANLEQTTDPSVQSSQEAVDYLVAQVKKTAPALHTQAMQMAAEARKSAAINYQPGIGGNADALNGQVSGIGVQNADGQYLAGKALTVTMEGPAVFSATGTQTWSGLSADQPLNLEWRATGTGRVNLKTTFAGDLDYLSQLGNPNTQVTVQLPKLSDPYFVTVSGNSWSVRYDFQPIGVSHVDKISTDGSFVDVFTAQADPHYGSGQWLEVGGAPVPVVYEATAYYIGDHPITATADVPAAAQVIGVQHVTAVGPGEISAQFTGAPPGFATVVWRVVHADQPAQSQPYIHGDWSDHYGLAEETVSHHRRIEVDTAAAIRTTQSGIYLVDDIWVSGFPEDHGSFSGDERFTPDVATLTQRLLFFPEGVEVRDENIEHAEKIAEVEIPARNGFYPTSGSPQFRVRTDEQGNPVVGTYVFVTEFAGDSRVAPFRSSVSDTTEQFSIGKEPRLHTTLRYHNTRLPIPALNHIPVVDQVCYLNVTPGTSYEIVGELYDRDTGAALTDSNGKANTSRVTLQAEQSSGCVDVSFVVDASALAGHHIVAMESLYHDGKEVASHRELSDEKQTLPVSALQTTASAPSGQIARAAGQVITDTVCETSGAFVPGAQYTVRTWLVDERGELVRNSAGDVQETAFQPHDPQQCAQINVEFDARTVSGDAVVVFEEIYAEGVLVAAHRDLQDTAQRVTLPPNVPPRLSRTGSATLLIGVVALALLGAGAAAIRISVRR